jgi:RNA polymerase sigma factor (sigma-70 family)
MAVAMDRELVVRAQGGDLDAFSRLAAGSLGRLNAVARLIVRDESRAEDAVQETLVDAWRDLRGLRDPDRFDAWLNRILVRACQDASRRDWRRRAIELPFLATDDVATPDVQASLARSDELERGLRSLSVDQRTVLVLAFYLDLSLADAAATLGIPLGTMKSRLHRALDALRASLEAEERWSVDHAERLA